MDNTKGTGSIMSTTYTKDNILRAFSLFEKRVESPGYNQYGEEEWYALSRAERARIRTKDLLSPLEG